MVGEKVNIITAHKPVLLRGPQGDYTFVSRDAVININNQPDNVAHCYLRGCYGT